MDPARIARAADRARAATAARNQGSVWLVSRPGGEGTTDPVTGDWTPPTPETFTVDAHFKSTSRPSVKVRSDTALVVEGPRLCVASGERLLQVDDTVSQHRCGEPALDGRAWRVMGPSNTSSYGIHTEYPIEEVTS